MKKIMFNDRYGLTKAVLEGRKTMTRRIIKAPKTMEGQWVSGFAICKRPGSDEVVEVMALDADEGMINNIMPKYKPGEVVAVAQSYEDAGYDPHRLQFLYLKEPRVLPFSDGLPLCGYVEAPIMYHAGWKNKMFVFPAMMPHQIRITNVRVERLQDISEEDCLNEGVFLGQFHTYSYAGRPRCPFNTPRDAFASLIDKVSGKGTWESNPRVFVYEFELVNVDGRPKGKR